MSMEAYLKNVIEGNQLKEFKDAFQMIEEFFDFKVSAIQHQTISMKSLNIKPGKERRKKTEKKKKRKKIVI